MKKVRFESPKKSYLFANMNESECHSPRPFIERHIQKHPVLYDVMRNETQIKGNHSEAYDSSRVVTYNNDPVQRYECSNSSPYPGVNKTCIPGHHPQGSQWLPSNELDLSMLDATSYQMRQSCFKPILKVSENRDCFTNMKKNKELYQPVLSSIENKPINPPNVLSKDNDFFIRRENLDKLALNINPLYNQFHKMSLDKENEPVTKKAENKFISYSNSSQYHDKQLVIQPTSPEYTQNNCMCHHCLKVFNKSSHMSRHQSPERMNCGMKNSSQYSCIKQPKVCTYCKPIQCSCQPCSCNIPSSKMSPNPQNPIDKKEWAIKMYQQHITDSMDIEKQTNIAIEKREPTVSDLFKIIKLQNEQLQLLQEKVDKFISGTRNIQTVQNTTEHIALNENEHKISIGVMTSFEMVRTSTIINKEVVKQTNDMSQLQCNQSHFSVKEVVSKTPPVNVNFLDGIVPIEKARQHMEKNPSNPQFVQQNENVIDEKTLNELSLCNVHIDNSTTPMMSPEPSLYLDVRDYSDSEASSVDQSNVGWTYYNKVMTHVNGMLEDTDMPSTASALYRNARQQCMQMQIDKTNVSVTKRVKFGDDVIGMHQLPIYAPSTDTSLKMNQLAAKYLKGGQLKQALPQPKPLSAPTEMSLATRNYMERHKIIRGVQLPSRSPTPNDIPKFLDITALKQQSKLL